MQPLLEQLGEVSLAVKKRAIVSYQASQSRLLCSPLHTRHRHL